MFRWVLPVQVLVDAIWLLAVAAALGADGGPQVLKPVVEGPEGTRAFADLERYYRDHDAERPLAQATGDLKSADAVKRRAAGKYMHALLVQSWADESNGRGTWQRQGLPAWGSEPESDTRGFRRSVAEQVGTQVNSPEVLDAALWLVEQDPDVENQKHGVTLLFRIQPPCSVEVVRKLLSPPHPCQTVLLAALDEARNRKLASLAPEVRLLCGHYRTAVRRSARGVASALGVREIPPYRPEEAFVPWLDRELKAIGQMVEGTIPGGARWTKYTLTYPPSGKDGKPYEYSSQGWMLGEDEKEVAFLSSSGWRLTHARQRTKLEPATLQQWAEELIKIRKAPADASAASKPKDALSGMGSLSAQFEPDFISVPEALAAAWLYERGEKKLAARVLFPCIDAAADDRWLEPAVRELLGNICHEEMLTDFAYERDYVGALRLASHLSRPVFAGYRYQDRAKQLVAQLPKRADDFKGFCLPTGAAWSELKKKLARKDQIEYLAPRLRLLNCFQWGQPGGVNYNDPQAAEPGRELALLATTDPTVTVINPYVELCRMDLRVAELPALVPYLADENFMLTFSFWRDFHPDRELHQVNWAVARVINAAARREVVQIGGFCDLNAERRRAFLDSILAWCRRNADKTPVQLQLEAIAEVETWPEFRRAARDLAKQKRAEALPIIVRRLGDFHESCRGEMVSFCYHLDSSAAVPYAREWLASAADDEMQLWAALILLRHGDKASSEGWPQLTKILAKDDGCELYASAVGPLLELKSEKAAVLACGILKREKFEPSDFLTAVALQELFLAGRQECLDYLLAKLDRRESAEKALEQHGDESRMSELASNDWTTRLMTYWKTGSESSHLGSRGNRQTRLQELKSWLKEQFALVKQGKTPKMNLLSQELVDLRRASFDAP
ncbi:MAG: hypothetical protein ACYC35_18070 [Pirellulales bacterium]